MKRKLASPLVTALATIAISSLASAQSYEPSFDGMATGLAASTGDGLLDPTPGALIATGEVDYTHGTVSSDLGTNSGWGYSDARFALVQGLDGFFYRHDPVSGAFVRVEASGGRFAVNAQMNPVTGAVTFQTYNDSAFYRMNADGSVVSLPAPPNVLTQWGRPNGSDSFVGTDGKSSYLFSDGTWTTLSLPDFGSSLMLTNVDLYGPVDYMSGYARAADGRTYIVAAKLDGGSYDLIDTGLAPTLFSAPDEAGRMLVFGNGLTDVLTIGKGDDWIANPAGTLFAENALVSNGLFVTTFFQSDFSLRTYTLGVAAVPEPGPLAAMALGCVLFARRRSMR